MKKIKRILSIAKTSLIVLPILLSSCWSDKSDIEQASILSKVEIPENSLCLYSKHRNVIHEISDEFVFKILPKSREDFCKRLEKSSYTKLTDTIVVIRFCPLGHTDTVRNGYMKYDECLKNYYYDSDKGYFYVRNIDD